MTSTRGSGEGRWRTVREEPAGGLAALVHPLWRERHPWLVQGTTLRGPRGGHDGAAFDLGIFSDASPARVVMEAWEALRDATGLGRAVVAPQVHGAAVRMDEGGARGLFVTEACDGHVTREPGTLLAITAADCVPVSIIEPGLPAVAMLHAGWRGVAAGVLEAGLAALAERLAARAEQLEMHLGPAICGDCYEVGPEVPRSLGLPEPSSERTTVDLRRALAARAQAAGIPAAHITISEHCTLCGDGLLFSHRGGDRERHVGYVGVRG